MAPNEALRTARPLTTPQGLGHWSVHVEVQHLGNAGLKDMLGSSEVHLNSHSCHS